MDDFFVQDFVRKLPSSWQWIITMELCPASVTSMVLKALSVRNSEASASAVLMWLAEGVIVARLGTLASLIASLVIAPPLHSVILCLVGVLLILIFIFKHIIFEHIKKEELTWIRVNI